MPELPEVETVVRGLAPVLTGRVLARVELHRADLRRPFPHGLVQHLTGARVTEVARRAKYGLIATDRGDTAIFHLGMSGRMRLDPTDIGLHDHVVLTLDDGRRIAFNDARRFGSLDLTPTAELADHPLLAGLGPEPLTDLTPAHLAAAFAGRLASVRARLLDQRVVAGLGNIYVAEALHVAKLNPDRPAGLVPARRLPGLIAAIRAVLTQAIDAGGSSLRDHVQPNGELGYFQDRWRVYGREGQPCPVCGTTVTRNVDAGRSSFRCRRCQR